MRKVADIQYILDLNRRFHDEVEAHGYDQRMGVDHGPEGVAGLIGELERVLGAPLPSGGLVVDCGAGTGNVAIKLAIDGRFDRVMAIDISEGMLATAKRTAERLGLTLETRVSTMDPLPLETDSVDCLVGCAMLHHLPDVEAFMAEAARVLKPGAPCVFIGEPSVWGARVAATVKAPLVAVNKLRKRLTGHTTFQWEHDNIDVHCFSPGDVRTLTRDLEGVRFEPEGFLGPALDQGLLAPVQHVFGHLKPVSATCGFIRERARELDRKTLDARLPAALLASVKFSGYARPRT